MTRPAAPETLSSDSPPDPGPHGWGHGRWVAVGAATLVVALAAAAAGVGLTRPHDGPAVLHLRSAPGTSAEASAGGIPGYGGYVLVGTLPDGPDHGSAYRLTPPEALDPAALATAFGMSGTPTRVGDAWVLADGVRKLRMGTGTGHPWALGTAQEGCRSLLDEDSWPSLPSDTVGVGCASTGPASRTPPPALPAGDAVAATRAARDVLGLSDSPARAVAGLPASVTVSPVVDGRQTASFDTWFSVSWAGSARPVVTDGSGWWTGATVGDRYPMVSATTAFDALRALPRPELGMPCVDATPDPCAPRKVTGAVLGLQLAWDTDRPLLVPAWLFQVQGSDLPVAMNAVDPAYLAPPAPTDGGTVPAGTPASAPGAVPGSSRAGSSGAASTGSRTARPGPAGDVPVPRTG